MKLEAGQVWRRPDGTHWLVMGGVFPAPGNVRVANMEAPHAQLEVPELAVLDGWKLEHQPKPIRDWDELSAEEQAKALSTPLPDEGT